MTVATLPTRSPPVIFLAVVLIGANAVDLIVRGHLGWADILCALLLSCLLADMITSLAHFSFDYIFPYDFPIFGPIAAAFNEHHDAPSLDPKDWAQNLTLGGYGSCAVSAVSLLVMILSDHGPVESFCQFLLMLLAIWGLLFHHLHSYAHMGSLLDPQIYKREAERIALLPDKLAQREEFRRLFAPVPIPRPIKLLQRLRLTLDPVRHNLHHLHFESDFSSVNGWSHPLLNPVLGPAARYFKARRLRLAEPVR